MVIAWTSLAHAYFEREKVKYFYKEKIAKSDDLAAKKSLYLEIFGLNLKMKNKKVGIATEQFQTSPRKAAGFCCAKP